MFLPSYNLNIAPTLAVTTASQRIDCERMSHVSFQVTQDAAGVSWAMTIQNSNDGINWGNTATTTTITGPGTTILERAGCCSRFYRVNLVATSGTLTNVTAFANGSL